MENRKTIVIYKSKTGFTEKYANWIADELSCDAVCLEKFNIKDVANYDIVIFGGGTYAGRINGLKSIKNNMSLLKGKKVIVFATGATPPIPEEIERIRKGNIPSDSGIEFFYFQSGINYERMQGMDRLLMGMFKAVLKNKKDKSDIEKGASDAIQDSYDCSDRSQIEPLCNYINSSGDAI